MIRGLQPMQLYECLPVELIHLIIKQLTIVLPTRLALDLRLVCHDFDQQVSTLMFCQELKDIRGFFDPADDEGRCIHVLSPHVRKFVRQNIQMKRTTDPFFRNLRYAVDSLLSRCDGSQEPLRSTHECVAIVCDAVAATISQRRLAEHFQRVSTIVNQIPAQDLVVPLALAAGAGLDEYIIRTISKDPSINRIHPLFGNPLSAAAFQGRASTVALLLRLDSEPFFMHNDRHLDTKLSSRKYAVDDILTALSLAAVGGHTETVSLLMEMVDLPNCPIADRSYCYQLANGAIISRNLCTFKLISDWLDVSKSLDYFDEPMDDLSKFSEFGPFAARHGASAILNFLIEKFTSNGRLETLLKDCGGERKCCKLACKVCHYLRRAMHEAATHDHRECMSILLNAGCSLEAYDETTCESTAVVVFRISTLEWLLDHGYDFNTHLEAHLEFCIWLKDPQRLSWLAKHASNFSWRKLASALNCAEPDEDVWDPFFKQVLTGRGDVLSIGHRPFLKLWWHHDFVMRNSKARDKVVCADVDIDE